MPRRNNKPASAEFSSKSWIIKEKKWDSRQQQVSETKFTLGNGYVCCRGILEEVPYDSYPGTYMGGIYDRTGAQITELVNLPNPVNFRFDVYGEKLDPMAMDIVHHNRRLDLRRGTLFRHTLYKTTHKKRLDYRSRRFVSLHNRHLIVMEIELTPLDSDMTVNAQTIIDTGVQNRGVLTEGRKRHYEPFEVRKEDRLSYVCVRTFEKNVYVACASAVEICCGKSCRIVADRSMNIRVKKGETIIFRKFTAVATSREVKQSDLRRFTMSAVRSAFKRGICRLTEDNEKAWMEKWHIADIDIEGDLEATRALRFNMFHLIIAGDETSDDVSIGARSLSGEGYRGHVFWDTELFVLPFFIYTNPQVAENLLLYRYHRLDAARNNAAARGFKGALFPWESADTGEECTPSWAKNFDGSIIKIVTMDEEHHIVADVAYAFAHYFHATGSDEFFWKYALEVMLETARFWSSRMVFNSKRKRYEMQHVMGPDEFHEDVNNNAYTNALAQWNMSTAAEWCERAKKEKPACFKRLTKQLNLDEKEIAKWRKTAALMHIPFSKKRNLIEPFDGFFRLKNHRITQLDEHLMPCLPAAVDWSEVNKTQLIKQADVVMLLYLMSEKFSLTEKRRNYYFNERRTLHKSSLSPAIHSIVGLEVGDDDKALHYFSHALSTDLSNIHGNTAEGFHAASGGGTWQAAIMGFAGMRLKKDVLSFNPHLPAHWKGMKFCVLWHGCRLRVDMAHAKTEICLEHQPHKQSVSVQIYGQVRELRLHEFIRFNAVKPAKSRIKKGRRKK